MSIPPTVVKKLRQPNPAVMATVRPDGSPVTVATWYLWHEGRILLNLDNRRRRLAHLRTNPRVSLTVLDGTAWHRHISVQGTVTLEDDPDLRWIDTIAQHYTGRPYRDREHARVNAWLEIERLHLWGFERGVPE
jgi:PPOX class probable F420-dependent enzyme